MAVPTLDELKNILKTKQVSISSMFYRLLDTATHNLKKLKESYVLKNPIMLYESKILKLDGLTDNLKKSIDQYLIDKKTAIDHLQSCYILQNPRFLYEKKIKDLENINIMLEHCKTNILNKKNQELQMAIQTLKLVNPLNILDKGYSLVKKENHIIKDSSDLKLKDNITIRFSKGEADVIVKEIRK